MALLAAGALAGMAVTLVLAVAAYLARQDAQRSREQAEDLVSFMVGDLRERLEPVGRLDVLDAVGDKAMAYFAGLKSGEVNDGTLSNRARALTQIGEIRLQQGRSEEALAAFREAYTRTRELSLRNPASNQRLFDRGQVEFWIGFVHLERNELGEAEAWLTRYQDTSAKLVSREPDNADWQQELAYALHNVGVVRLRAARPAEAAAAFETARNRLESLLARQGPDPELTFALADEIAWQALVAEQDGEPAKALHLYREHAERLQQLIDEEPRNMAWRQPAANAHQHLGRVALQLGDLSAAGDAYQRALDGLRQTTRHDPGNLEWRRDLVACHRGLAEVHLAGGRTPQALEHAALAVEIAEAIVSSDPVNNDWLMTLSDAEATYALAVIDSFTRNPGAKAPGPEALALDNNVALAERLLTGSPADPKLRRTAARAWLALAYGLRAQGEPVLANEAFARVVDTVAGRETDPDLGLQAVRALSGLGKTARAETLARQLIDAGYGHPVLLASCESC